MKSLLLVLATLLALACPPPAPTRPSCTPNPCTEGDRTACTVVDGLARCSCREGFDEVAGLCVARGPCAANPCTLPNRGVCVASGATAICQCNAGFRDDGAGQCVAVTSCTPNPCTRPGRTVCTEGTGAVTCSCEAGLRDDGAGGCVSTNPCATNPCTEANRTVCVAQGLAAVCRCDAGFVEDGSGRCVAAQSCTPNPCTLPNRTRCSVAQNVVSCACDPGYRMDAIGQCVAIDPCVPNPCTAPNRSVCLAVGGTATCGCDQGYQLDGLGQCVAIDPCMPNPCSAPNKTVCTNQGGAATCGCVQGYRPDALGQCVPNDACVPNPCLLPNRDVCTPVGSTAICSCRPGFHDVAGACVPDDPCQPNPCSRPNEGVCMAGADAGVTCSCNPGYQPAANGCELPLPPTCANQHTSGDSFEPDECPALAKPIVPGVPQAHTFAPAGDVDFVTFTADAGAVVRFDESGPIASSLTLLDSDGVTPLLSNQTDLLMRKVPRAGAYFVQVRAPTPTTTGATTFLLTLSLDDHADDRAGAAPLMPAASPGTSLTGRFDFPGDLDCLAVPVTANRIYALEETTGTDVYLQVLTATGTYLPSTDAELLRFRSTTTETLFFCARAAVTSSLASWTLRATDEGADDHPNTAPGAVTLPPAPPPGASVSGRFEYAFDADCVSVPVLANRVFTFEETTATDVYLWVLTDTGTFISQTDSEALRFETSTAQTLHFCTRAYSSSSLASWTLRVTDHGADDHADGRAGASALVPSTAPGTSLTGRFDYPFDVDCLAVPVQAGLVYAFEETTPTDVYLSVLTSTGTFFSRTDSEALRFEASTSQTLFFCTEAYSSSSLASWTLRVTEIGADDHADGRAGATTLTPSPPPGASLVGQFDYPFDLDCLAVPVQADRVYVFEEASGTDVYLSVLTATGTFVSRTDSELLRFKTSTAETLTLCTEAYSSSSLASWTLRVTDLGPDDHADGRVGASPLVPAAAPGTSVTGRFDFFGDVDCLAVPVVAARIYAFEEVSATDVYLNVLTATGTALARTDSESWQFKAATSETLFFCTSAWSSSSLASWTLRVTDLGLDDHEDLRGPTATPLAIGGAAMNGAIQFSGDVDVFSFEATSVLALRVVTTGQPVSVQVVGSSGAVIASGSGPGTLAFVVPAPGTAWVTIRSSSFSSYTVAIGN
ncbi:MAG: hypothetical protein JNJ54_08095 [Myxococcaceae bacterium]|nr:hypothetical protein [Myxococcaceae bacterium]